MRGLDDDGTVWPATCRSHPRYKLRTCLTLIAFLLVSRAPETSASDWNVDLLQPPGPHRLSSDPLQLDVSGVPPDALASLYLLLDDIEVTEFASVEGALVTISLGVPLAPGPHELSLVELSQAGTTHARGEWTFLVRQSEHFESAGVRADVTQNGWVRVDEGDASGLPNRVSGDGALRIEGAVERSGFRLSGDAPMLWDSQEETYLGDTGTVGNWIVRGTKGPGGFAVGHHEVGQSSLVMDGFSRRGASMDLHWDAMRTSVSGFSVRGAPVVGFKDGIGLADEENRVSGVRAASRIVESSFGDFDLSGVWVTGKSPDGGSALSGVAGDLGVLDGSAWEVEGRVSLFDRRIEAAGSFARSHADFGGNTAKVTDDAHRIEVAIEPFPNASVREYPLRWRTTFDESEIGTDFLSLANGRLLPDRRIRAVRSEFNWAGLGLTGYAGRIDDNVHRSGVLPRLRADAWSLDATFSPEEILGGERRGVLRWLGMPRVTGSYRHDRLDPRKIPSTFNPAATLSDTSTDTGTASLLFVYDSWSWSADYTIINTHDRSTGGISSIVQLVSLRADVYLGEVALGGSFQFDRNKFDGLPNQNNYLAGMNLSAPLYRDQVFFNADVSVNHSHASDDSDDRVGVVTSAGLDWLAIEATEQRPGLSFSVLGSYQGVRDDIMNGLEADAFQLFLRSTISWPLAWGSL